MFVPVLLLLICLPFFALGVYVAVVLIIEGREEDYIYLDFYKFYQNTETNDLISMKEDDMILIEEGIHKGEFIKKESLELKQKLYYYVEIITED